MAPESGTASPSTATRTGPNNSTVTALTPVIVPCSPGRRTHRTSAACRPDQPEQPHGDREGPDADQRVQTEDDGAREIGSAGVRLRPEQPRDQEQQELDD